METIGSMKEKILEIINSHLVDLYLHGLRYGYETNTPLIETIINEIEAAIAERMPTELINTAEWLLMDSALKCPHCGGVGFTVKPNYYTGEPEQEQCRWCHEFNWFRSRMEEKK
jgi:hypothetical protein